MGTKSRSKSKLLTKALLSIAMPAGHMILASQNVYKCSKTDCDGTLDYKFQCKKCKNYSVPGLKRH